MYASREGHEGIVKALLAANADINIKDEHGGTALMEAASWEDNEGAVKLLLGVGAERDEGMEGIADPENTFLIPKLLQLCLSDHVKSGGDDDELPEELLYIIAAAKICILCGKSCVIHSYSLLHHDGTEYHFGCSRGSCINRI